MPPRPPFGAACGTNRFLLPRSCHQLCWFWGLFVGGGGLGGQCETPPGLALRYLLGAAKGSTVCGRLCWAWGCVGEAKLCTKVGSPSTEPGSGSAPGDRPPCRLLSQEEPDGLGTPGRWSPLGAVVLTKVMWLKLAQCWDRGHSAPASGPAQAGPCQLPGGLGGGRPQGVAGGTSTVPQPREDT